MAKILVTGGAGYIGSHTAYFLKRSGHQVAIVDDLSRGHIENVQQTEFHKLNLLETDALTGILNDGHFDAVIHFAAYIAVGESTKDPILYFSNNTAGSISLFTAMQRAGVGRLVFSSTAAVYGNPQSVPIAEDELYAALSPYGDSKVMVEKTLAWLDEFRGFRSIALRYFNACGAEPGTGLGEQHDPETHLIPLLFRAVDTGKPVTIFGSDYATADGTCIRDYIHVSDLAAAHVKAVEWLMKDGESGRFNVGTGRGQSVMAVLRAVEEVTGKQVPYVIGPRREGDPAELVANSDRLQQTLGWRPEYTDIRKTVQTAWEYHCESHAKV